MIFNDKLKIGLLIPPPNIVMEEEFNKILLPYNISVHANRLYRSTPELTIETLEEMGKSIEETLFLLNMINPDVIIFGCTSGSLIYGYGWDKTIIDRMMKYTTAKVTTTSTSVIKAIKKLKMKNIAIVTPYIDQINKKEKDFLLRHGINTLEMRSFNIKDAKKIPNIKEEDVIDLVNNFYNLEELDGIFISCTNLRSFSLIDRLEKKINKPVVTSNQASLWDAINFIKRNIKIKGIGRLFE